MERGRQGRKELGSGIRAVVKEAENKDIAPLISCAPVPTVPVCHAEF